jgi:hypothetical protein
MHDCSRTLELENYNILSDLSIIHPRVRHVLHSLYPLMSMINIIFRL